MEWKEKEIEVFLLFFLFFLFLSFFFFFLHKCYEKPSNKKENENET